jgi:hypothetical protein
MKTKNLSLTFSKWPSRGRPQYHQFHLHLQHRPSKSKIHLKSFGGRSLYFLFLHIPSFWFIDIFINAGSINYVSTIYEVTYYLYSPSAILTLYTKGVLKGENFQPWFCGCNYSGKPNWFFIGNFQLYAL